MNVCPPSQNAAQGKFMSLHVHVEADLTISRGCSHDVSCTGMTISEKVNTSVKMLLCNSDVFYWEELRELGRAHLLLCYKFRLRNRVIITVLIWYFVYKFKFTSHPEK